MHRMDKKSEKIDPIDNFVNDWMEKIEIIKNTPIPPEKREEYLKDFDDNMRCFEESNKIVRPNRGFQKINHPFFHIASPEENTEKFCKSKYSANEIFYKLDNLTTSVRLAVNQGEEKYKDLERKHQEEMIKHKKGIFDNAKIFIGNLIGKG